MTSTSSSPIDRAIVDLVAKNLVTVPPYPAVALKIGALIRSERYGLDDLAAVVTADPVLAADILRLASSAAYGRGGPVTSIGAGIARVGANEVARLAIASGLSAYVHRPGPLSSARRLIWQESLSAAVICQQLAASRHLSDDDAFSCGLLHDFGRLVAAAAIEEILTHVQVPPSEPLSFWMEVIERYHVELGQVIAARWNLSRLLADVIGLHHGGALEACQSPGILEVVMAADEVVAVARRVAHVSGDDLAEAPHLRGAEERELAARAVLSCPAIIASLEAPDAPPAPRSPPPRSPQPGAPAPRPSLPAPPASAEPFHALELAVTNVARPRDRYRAVGISPHLLVLTGEVALHENFLVQLELEAEPAPFRLWANVTACVPAEGNGFRMDLRPFALNGEANKRWLGLLREGRPVARSGWLGR